MDAELVCKPVTKGAACIDVLPCYGTCGSSSFVLSSASYVHVAVACKINGNTRWMLTQVNVLGKTSQVCTCEVSQLTFGREGVDYLCSQ